MPYFLVPGAPYSPARKLLLNMELVESLFDLSDLQTIVAFGRSCKYMAMTAQWYLRRRLNILSARFFDNCKDLAFVLEACDAVVSGSTALHFLLPIVSTPWSPTDLDIYVPFRCQLQLSNLLKQRGYHLEKKRKSNESRSFYSGSKIFAVLTFTKAHNKIDVVVSTSDCAVLPVFQFHCTAVMNFITPNSIFYAYPSLTFQSLSMMNGSPLYNGSFSPLGVKALIKYKKRGFVFISCPATHEFPFACKSANRCLTDGGCLWVDIDMVPRAGKRPENMFGRLAVIDVNWALGGLLCGAPAAFVRPYVRETGDDSYVLFTFVRIWH